jgi:hypothetical protein
MVNFWIPKIAGRRLLVCMILLMTFTACTPPTPAQAAIMVTLDMGSGGAGFAATIYAQEITSGITVSKPYSAGSHGLVVLPTSEPVKVLVNAPGTYVIYARLVNEPESYHYGATGCGPAEDCADSSLLAFSLEPGETIVVVIADRSAVLPEKNQPVSVPWRLAAP